MSALEKRIWQIVTVLAGALVVLVALEKLKILTL